MATHIHDALTNIKEIFTSDSSLATLLDFERVIDNLDVYVFENWKLGELVEGPVYEKYFVTCTFMWPYKKMPDPSGGEQLLNYNCEVIYKKSRLEFPVKPKSPDDFKPNTKMSKKKSVPIWLVTITIPKKLMSDIQKGSIDLENEKLELEDLDQAFETGVDEEADSGQAEQQAQPDMDGSMDPNMAPPAAPPQGGM